jgi:hypothetical protein
MVRQAHHAELVEARIRFSYLYQIIAVNVKDIIGIIGDLSAVRPSAISPAGPAALSMPVGQKQDDTHSLEKPDFAAGRPSS